jgi:hypothetical protein
VKTLATATLLLVASLPATGAAQDEGTYQAVMMRAAPGRLLNLIDALKGRLPVYQAAGEPKPILLRHAQGDQWDLVLLIPVTSVADHQSPEYQSRWQSGLRQTGFDDAEFRRRQDEWVSWQEELYVTGPPVGALQSAVTDAGYFHLEIFQALAGKRDSLLDQRAMENEFLRRIGRPTNFLFRKITGPAWDVFTLGLYRDLRHYAEPSGRTPEEEDAAARAAGFLSRGHIGPYLRQFLNSHHDTLGTIVR